MMIPSASSGVAQAQKSGDDAKLTPGDKTGSVSPEAKLAPVSGKAHLLPGLLVAILVAGFSVPLYRLADFALRSDLFSYVLLVPAISAYLFWQRRAKAFSADEPRRSSGLGILLLALGAGALGCYLSTVFGGKRSTEQDMVALGAVSFVFLLSGICALLLRRPAFQVAVFPLSFLVFMAPLPTFAESALEHFLQHGSAPPAAWFFSIAGTPFFKQDLVFQLPGMTLQIAPECSGIRSTLVLFMTSLLAGHLFLRSPWKKLFLTVFVIPLALVRNGFRVFTIGELCVHIGPHMIDSDIHHKGGAIFFALSLVPFFTVLYFLARSDRLKNCAAP